MSLDFPSKIWVNLVWLQSTPPGGCRAIAVYTVPTQTQKRT